MGVDNMLTLAATEAQHAAEECGGDVVEKLKAAMAATKTHWMVTDDNVRFRAAVVGACMAYPDGHHDRTRIEVEARALVDIASGHLPDEPVENPIGLLKLWRNAVCVQR